jgi:hypothetical protein
MLTFLSKNIKYKYQNNEQIQMSFLVSFIIDRTGKVTNTKMLNKLTATGKAILEVFDRCLSGNLVPAKAQTYPLK